MYKTLNIEIIIIHFGNWISHQRFGLRETFFSFSEKINLVSFYLISHNLIPFVFHITLETTISFEKKF